MKKLLCIYYLLCIATLAYAQDLRFNANGKFKIVQFTDVHYIFNDSRAEVAIERINEVLNAENPNLVMFTGDIIYGKPVESPRRSPHRPASAWRSRPAHRTGTGISTKNPFCCNFRKS